MAQYKWGVEIKFKNIKRGVREGRKKELLASNVAVKGSHKGIKH